MSNQHSSKKAFLVLISLGALSTGSAYAQTTAGEIKVGDAKAADALAPAATLDAAVPRGGGGGGGGGSHPNPGGGGGGGYHPPAPSNGGGGYHPPAPSNGGGGYHPPAPSNGGGGYHPPAPSNGGGGYHPPAPSNGGGGYHPPAPSNGGGGNNHPPAPSNGGGGGDNHPPSNGGGNDNHPGNGGGDNHPPSNGGGNDNHPGNGGSGHPGNGGGNNGHPGNGGGGFHPGPGAHPPIGHVSNHGNSVTPSHLQDIQHSQQRIQSVMRRNAPVAKFVDGFAGNWRSQYRPRIEANFGVYDGWRQHWGPIYQDRGWWDAGFYGCYWGIDPVYDMDTAFYDGTVFWLFSTEYNQEFYSTWYGANYGNYPWMNEPFSYAGYFYPTSALVDLSSGISSQTMDQQGAFHEAIAGLYEYLTSTLASGLGHPVVLDQNSVVIDHYQVLDSAVVVNGFVGYNGQSYAFEALLDLTPARQDIVFMPTSLDGAPSPSDLAALQVLNNEIMQLGGTIETPDQP